MTPLVGDPRFFARSGPYTVAQLAHATGAHAASDPDRVLTGVAPLAAAGAHEISFLDNARYRKHLATTGAGAVLIHPDLMGSVPGTTAAIVLKGVYEGWAIIAGLFHPVPPIHPGVHPSAVVDPTASVDATAEVGPFVCIGAMARIGQGTRIGSHVSIGDGVVVGRDCRIAAHVTISHAMLEDRVTLHPGVRIGQEGFGFAQTAEGFLSLPQLGRVMVGSDVDIGANTTIDRGSVRDTVIGAGSRLDNLVQIGHNVRLGRCCVIVAQGGISGSTELADFVQVGGQAAMAGHLQVGAGAKIGAQAGVIGDVAAGATMLGSPAQSRTAFFRQVAVLKKLAERPRPGAGPGVDPS